MTARKAGKRCFLCTRRCRFSDDYCSMCKPIAVLETRMRLRMIAGGRS